MNPDVLHKREGVQLSYRLPHRISDTCIYPRRSPNGSTIIVYAHEKGLRAIWYGGRQYKANSSPKVNGDSIDLTDEGEDVAPEYEEEDEELDPSRPFHNVLAHLDVELTAPATKIAVPPLSSEPSEGLPQILNSHAILLTACADSSLRLISIPLQPPRDSSGPAQQITIGGANSHQDLVSGVAITISATPLEEEGPQQGRASSRTRSQNPQDVLTPLEWSCLIASTSATGTGLLLIHQIPLDSNGHFSHDVEDHVPVQRKYLRCSLATCHIAFNTALYPSPRHSNLVMASADSASVKIYQATPQIGVSRKRRGSTTTVDSAMSGNQSSRRSAISDKVLIDLMLPFHQTDATQLAPQRKRVLGAQWVLHGRAVIVLLDDGEWGIWDLEAAGPPSSASANNLVRGQANVSGIQGGSLTRFAVKGNLRSGGAATKKSSSSSSKVTADTSLAPMTPHTRKTRSDGLFKGQDQSSETKVAFSNRSTHGSLAVQMQTKETAGQMTHDESVVLNFESVNVLIPSIQTYWRSEVGGRGVFDASSTSRPVILPQLQTANETQQVVYLLPRAVAQTSNGLFATTKPSHDFLTSTSSRLILFVAPLVESSVPVQTLTMPMRSLADSSINQDQVLLNSGELDVDGMDRILDSMANSSTLPMQNSTALTNGFGRKSVGFLFDDNDEDTDMGTPTQPKSSKSKLVIDKGSNKQEGVRRLFT